MHARRPGGRRSLLLSGASLAMPLMLPTPAHAASLSARALAVIGRIATFLIPPPTPGAPVLITYAPNDAASRADAEAIAALIGDGLKVGAMTLPTRLADASTLSPGHYSLVIAAQGANLPQASAAVRASHALCITADLQAVQGGLCTMVIRSEPRMDVIVNRSVAVASGIDFAVAFRMMIQEI
jgi:hypothetical protein